MRNDKVARILTIIFSVITLVSFAPAKDKRWIFGFGTGYSRSLFENALQHRTWVSLNNDFFYDEEGSLDFSFTAYSRFFITSGIGVQLEFHRQNGNYYGYLQKWIVKYLAAPLPAPADAEPELITKTIREDPRHNDWSINSITLSGFLAWRKAAKKEDYLFLSAGVGYYILDADKELVLHRFPLGPDKTGFVTKITGGYKHSFHPNIGISFRLNGEFHAIRELGGTTLYARESLFNPQTFIQADMIVRKLETTPATFSYFGLDIILEFTVF